MSEQRDFLVELGTEELPPKALRTLELAFAAGIETGLDKAYLAHGPIVSFSAPRRLAVRVERLTDRQPDQDIKRKGPPVTAAFDKAGNPTRAATAFAQSCGTSVEALIRVEEARGTFLYFEGRKPGQPVADLLPAVVQEALDALPIPKRMRWGAGEAEFVRPVHWLVMLYGSQTVPARLLDTAAGYQTQGHRFHAPHSLTIAEPRDYEKLLKSKGHVLASFMARRELIEECVKGLAAELGGRALIEEALLDEVTALVEWPVPLAGGFEERFLALPREVLISTLQDHQRYFPVEDAQGALLPAFITVSNIESREPAKVRQGNERVVRPRLADAAFFWEQDRRQPLAARREGLDAVTFQAKLGSLGDKTRRVRSLAGEIATARGAARADVQRAAELCKCDLLTAVVGEFPELQGIMGTYYAREDGESAEVARAIREHYLPRGAGDELPATDAGVVLAIADKLDTLAAIFAIGEKPTGTKDPFGLRRAAIGVLRILVEKGLDLDLQHFVARALDLVRADMAKVAAGAGKPALAVSLTTVSAEIYEYMMERLRAYYLERPASPGAGVMTTEMFDAVLAARPSSPLDFDARLRALATFLELPEAGSLTAANKRIANILRKSGGERPAAELDVKQLKEAAEIRLHDSMLGLRDAVAASVAERQYANALGRLAQLRPAVDTFFDQVMVMAEDRMLRANRLALLAQLQGLFAGIADLSRLPG
jgi:glycyl-tRNA synthetase beta chain